MRLLGTISLSAPPLVTPLLFCSLAEEVPSPLSSQNMVLPHEDNPHVCLGQAGSLGSRSRAKLSVLRK